MNERIKELAKQAGAAYGDGYDFYLLEDHIEKFAELIVRECAKISIGDDPSFLEASALEDGARRMLKHFGVEE